LKQLRSSVRRTAAERVQLSSRLELVAEAKVGDLDVQVAIQQQVLRLSQTPTDTHHHLQTERSAGNLGTDATGRTLLLAAYTNRRLASSQVAATHCEVSLK